MQNSAVRAVLGACLVASVFATPTPVEGESVTAAAIIRQASGSPVSGADQLSAALGSLTADYASVSAFFTVAEAIFTNIVPAPGPSSIPELASEFQKVVSANPGDILTSGAEILAGGFAGGDYVEIAEAYLLEDSSTNINPIPAPGIYPKASPEDAPYSLMENQLREVIYIPLNFSYGRKQPVLFIPGTGARAGSNFAGGLAKLVQEFDLGDPVYVNLPGENLADIQVAAEYVAYAINYISYISGHKNVSTISWSAGSLDGQWAFKYWPSTRSKVSNKIGISPDYHGTIEAQALCPGFVTPGCTPAIAQQNYNSTFIATLRNNGGDSAYVPTTNVYSIFDEIVEPQQDPNASGALNDARNVGVSNTEVQSVCTAFLPGGSPFNDHEGMLINALAFYLVQDALTHAGPGQLFRINTTAACDMFAAPTLGLQDVFNAYAQLPIAAVAVLAYEPKVSSEPPIMAYAQKDIPAGYANP